MIPFPLLCETIEEELIDFMFIEQLDEEVNEDENL